LNVTIALAFPFIAVSKTMSSSGSDSLGRHRNAKSNGPRDGRQVIENMTDFGTTQSTCGEMLGAGHDRFVLKYERNGKQQFKLPI
jgi:hypothetical protein